MKLALVTCCLLAVSALGGSRADAHPSWGIVVDPAGNVIFADERRSIVWKIAPDGALTKLVEGKHTHALAIDFAGVVHGEDLQYLSPTQSWRSSLWSVDQEGVVTTTWGPAAGFAPSLVMDAQGNRYDLPNGAAHGTARAMTLGPAGVLYFTDGAEVRTRNGNGKLSTLTRVTGAHDAELPGDIDLWGLTVDAGGIVLVADYGRRRVLEIQPDGQQRVLLRSEPPWSPTGVARAGEDVVVVEHGFRAPSTNLGPRVRRLTPAGNVRVLAIIELPVTPD